jgi:hypothetical protein
LNKHVIRTVVAAGLIGAGVWAGVYYGSPLEAETNKLTPGSIDDPVVTKSYVDEQLAKLSAGTPTGTPGGSTGGGTGGDAAEAFKVITVPAGKKLIAEEGTELILRAGNATIYSAESNGVADLTVGEDLLNGKNVDKNHHLLIPRAGRGIAASASGNAAVMVMVKGGYSIQ